MDAKVKQIQKCNYLGIVLIIFISSKAQESFKRASYYMVLHGHLKSEVKKQTVNPSLVEDKFENIPLDVSFTKQQCP